MQLFRIVSGIRVIGFVTTLLLWSAQSFEPAPKLYRAKPMDVPPWAEQGNFRFIRIDGGEIESWKAERTWWGKKFSAEEKDVLTHIYDRNFEQMLGLLKQAEFNWIWEQKFLNLLEASARPPTVTSLRPSTGVLPLTSCCVSVIYVTVEITHVK